jgi:hypothetical protein
MSTSFGALTLRQKAYKCYQPAFAHSQLEVAISFYQKQRKKTGANRPCLNHLSSRIQHVFYKYSVPSCRIIYQHMGHRAHQFAVLDNG